MRKAEFINGVMQERDMSDAEIAEFINEHATKPPTLEEYKIFMQSVLDAKPRERGYDGIMSLCTYATSTDPRFAAEGQAGVQWRDVFWTFGYALMAKVEAGEERAPTFDELAARLPKMDWPE